MNVLVNVTDHARLHFKLPSVKSHQCFVDKWDLNNNIYELNQRFSVCGKKNIIHFNFILRRHGGSIMVWADVAASGPAKMNFLMRFSHVNKCEMLL